MLYILGGAPRTGKSLLARQLVSEKNLPFISTDMIRAGLQDGLPELGIKHNRPFIPTAEAMWGVIKGIFNNIVEEVPNYLIEGDALIPKHVAKFAKEHPGQVISCFTGFASISPENKLAEIRSHESEKDAWTREHTDEEMLGYIKEMITFSKYLKEECAKHSIAYFNFSGDFEDALEKVHLFLTEPVNNGIES